MSRRRHKIENLEDRLPPHAAEAEQGVLGCILLGPEECLSECVRLFKGAGAKAFYDLRHQVIYEALFAMFDAHEHIDIITLQQKLKDAGTLEEVGGVTYLATLPDTVPSKENLPAYLELVLQKFLLRRMLTTLTEGAERVRTCNEPVPPLLDRIEASVLSVNQGHQSEEMPSLAEVVREVGELVENMHRGVGLISGIRTHFGYFDKMTGGLHRKALAVLAARPSLGKTSLMMNIARNVALREKIPVAVFSQEMTYFELVLRLMCAEAEVNFHRVRTGFPTKEDIGEMAKVAARVSLLPVYIDDTGALGILELRARARRMKQRWGVQLVCVDYLQLMHGSRDYRDNRAIEVAEISGGLKAMAKEMDVAVLVLSQLNREVERQKNRKPQLADLRESGSIEQDADLVGMLYRPKSENDEEEEGDVMPVNMLIAKQRNGPTGDVEFVFRKPTMQFYDAYGNRGARQQTMPAGEGRSVKDIIDREMPTNLELGISAGPKDQRD